jgi:hypothetical protein
MYSYNVPEFRYPVFSVNFNPMSNVLYNQYGNKILLQEIEKLLQSNQHLILDFNRDHANFLYGPTSILAVYNYFSSLGFKNILYLTSENIPDKPTIRFFPTWLYHKSKSYQNVQIQSKEYRKYPVSCLNRFPSPHRVYLFYHLLNKSYFEQCLTSFVGLRNPYNNLTDVGAYNEIYKDIPQNIKEFFASTEYSRMTESNIQDWNELHDPNYAAFTNSYLNVITESTYFHSFYTEKTAKPLVSEQLFLMVG